MKFALILLALASLYVNVESQLFHDTSVPDHTAFESFQEFFKRDYHPREKSKRFALFKESRRRVHSMNEKYKLGLITFKSKLNHFADLTREELKARTVGSTKIIYEDPAGATYYDENLHSRKKRGVPAALDHRTFSPSRVSAVEDQGNCGCGYAFAATSNVDSMNSITCNKGSLKYSSQVLVECSGPQGNSNCSSGTAPISFRYFIYLNSSVPQRQGYPFTSMDDGTFGPCRYNTSMTSKVQVTDFAIIKDEGSLLSVVANIGPCTTYMDVDYYSFFFCGSGVWEEEECKNNTGVMNHVMLIVGYGRNPNTSQDFWIIKNSWGTAFGVLGYIKTLRGNNTCCVACKASYPTVKCL